MWTIVTFESRIGAKDQATTCHTRPTSFLPPPLIKMSNLIFVKTVVYDVAICHRMTS
eukprot:m.70552 g.70552  ORF g.70552 m.70552 type:complete len:57 (+) comp12263_c0_seq6:1898-2068(+)